MIGQDKLVSPQLLEAGQMLKNTINQVAIFSKNHSRSNNAALMSDLSAVPDFLVQSCYNQLVAEVDQLSNYRVMTEGYYLNILLPQVENSLKDYDSNATGVFGPHKSTKDLWDKAREYCSVAVDSYSR